MPINNLHNDALADLLFLQQIKTKPQWPRLRQMQRKTHLKLVASKQRAPEGGNGVLKA